jgi:DNA-binding NtrC family response regulator
VKHGLRILLVDDDDAFRTVLAGELERLGFLVSTSPNGEEAVRTIVQIDPAVVLLDLQLPGIGGLNVLSFARENCPSAEVILLTGHGSIDTAIESIRLGAFDYVVKPCPLDELQIRIERAIERRALRQRTILLERGLTPPDLRSSFVGENPEFLALLGLIERVAQSNSTVLITGETGTGKEVAAKLIHARGPRRLRPFVVVECAALQESLLQSELFGHERGSFTGAERAKPGLFEVADGGTIFLDEIGEVSLATQIKLLRVLDTSTFRHVGGTAEVRVDVRVLAATNRDVAAMVRQGLFREDLYYRLRTIAIETIPLRRRGSDIDLLVRHFVSVFNERYQAARTIGPGVLELLRRHSWPGNVRELMHAVEAAMVVCDGPQILPRHLPAAVRGAAAGELTESGALPTLEALERSHIRSVLEACDGHRGSAAKALGISERSLYRKLHEFGLLP